MKTYFSLFILFLLISALNAREYTIESPAGNRTAVIRVDDQVSVELLANNLSIIEMQGIRLELLDKTLGASPSVKRKNFRTADELVRPLYGINDEIRDRYNELTLDFKGDYSIVFRLYDQGLAYRFVTNIKGDVTIVNEHVVFDFPEDVPVYQLGRANDWHGYETNYQFTKLSTSDSIAKKCLPFGFKRNKQYTCAILEADVLDYPGMYLSNASAKTLKAVFPAYPLKTKQDNDRGFNLEVIETADFIAKTSGTRSFPWRLVTINEQDIDLLNNELVYLLASPSKVDNTDWIKPGKVAWDWWNANNLHGVDFKTGFNTETYKYFIDFAAENNIPYVNLDEGWSDQFDLLDITDKLDMEEVVRYAHEKEVGLFLWCVWHTLDRQLVEALDLFEKWGIAGVKVDFMDRDDQEGVNFYERLLKEAAKRKILVNYHGAYKPTGLRRTYPNLINREAVMGLEFSKWSASITPEHDVTIPFLRMLAGPMDFTPGAMINANAANFCSVFERPMSQGTRCHQLAMFVVYFAPLQMLADAPTNYQADPKVLEYLSNVPVNWDETRVLSGEIGEYVAIARRSGDTWYIGAMTDWNPRTLELDLSFLNKNQVTLTVYEDGINADRNAIDYVTREILVDPAQLVTIELASGGGWVGIVR